MDPHNGEIDTLRSNDIYVDTKKQKIDISDFFPLVSLNHKIINSTSSILRTISK